MYRCRTVHWEHPRSAATSAMFRGEPSAGDTDSGATFVSAGCGQCCGFLCPGLGLENSNVSAAFAVSAAPYFSPSASLLMLMLVLLPPERPSDEFPKPFRKQLAPQPPEKADKNGEDNESPLELRSREECHESGDGQVNEENPEDDL